MKFPVISRVGDKFYCQHCNKTVCKSTFYEHQTLYGDSACGYTSHSEELELDVDCDSENDGVIPCCDDEVLSEEASADENESNVQPEQQIQVSLKC